MKKSSFKTISFKKFSSSSKCGWRHQTVLPKKLTEELQREKSYKKKKHVKEFPSRNWSLSSLKKIAQTSTVDHKPDSGYKTITAQNVNVVEELVLSQ